MVNTSFKIGDTVNLKSIGPPMSVSKLYYVGTEAKATCIWFDDSYTLHEAEFPIETLELYIEQECEHTKFNKGEVSNIN